MDAGGVEHRATRQEVKGAAHDAETALAWHGKYPLNAPGESGGWHGGLLSLPGNLRQQVNRDGPNPDNQAGRSGAGYYQAHPSASAGSMELVARATDGA